MILHEAKPSPYSTRILKVIFHPGLLFLKVAAIVILYFIIQEAGFTSLTKLLGFFLCFILPLLIFGYRHKLKEAAIQTVKVEINAKGLTVIQQNRDVVEQRFVPLDELHIDLRKGYNSHRDQALYSMQMFDSNSSQPLFNVDFTNAEIASLLQKIEEEKWRPLRAEERDFLIWQERTKTSTLGKVVKTRNQFRSVATIIFLTFAASIAVDNILFDSRLTHYLFNLYERLAGGTTSQWNGYWKVSTPEGSYTLTINESDSTITDNANHLIGKWQLDEKGSDSVLLIVEANEFKNVLLIASRTQQVIILQNGTVWTKVYNNEPATISLFGRLRSSVLGQWIIPTSYEITDSLYKKFVPLLELQTPGVSARILSTHNQFWITNFNQQAFDIVVSIDTINGSVNLGHYASMQGVLGECSGHFSVEPGSPTMIKSFYQCEEGEAQENIYKVLSNGNIVAREKKEDDTEFYDEGYWYRPEEGSNKKAEALNAAHASVVNKFLKTVTPGLKVFPFGIRTMKEHLHTVLAPASNVPSDQCDLRCLLKNFTGIDPLVRASDSTSAFNHYNTEFVKWFFDQMIPEPDEQFSGTTAHDVYVKAYRRAARIYTIAYCELYHLSGEEVEYEDASRQEGFYGPQYLHKRYGQAIPEYQNEKNSSDEMLLHPPQAFGFWLRRRIDGTDRQCWEGLVSFMKKYDPIWFSDKLSKYEIVVDY